MSDNDSSSVLKKTVQEQYSAVARNSGLSNDSEAVRSVALAFGYSEEELSSMPSESNMALSCGNPVALASIKPNEVVVDLGCGGGLDVFLAAKKVEPDGKVIGIDFSKEMLDRARKGAKKIGATNVEFHQATVESMPLPDDSVDVIISNCVINLVPDKTEAFQEMYRVLKPGGRVAISDIALKQSLPMEIKENMEAYVGCIAGAILIDEYREKMQQAGFGAVVVTDSGSNLNAYTKASLKESSCCGSVKSEASCSSTTSESCCGPSATDESAPLHNKLTDVLKSFDANAYAASVRVHAIKQK